MRGDAFHAALLDALEEADREGTEDAFSRAAGLIERVTGEWGHDKFAITVTVQRNVGHGRKVAP